MSLLFYDGFDQTSIAYKWSDSGVGCSLVTNDAYKRRTGTKVLYVPSYGGSTYYGPKKSFSTNYSSITIGTAFKIYSNPNNCSSVIFRITDGVAAQVSLVLLYTNILSVYRGEMTTHLKSSTVSLITNVWYYIEFQATIHDTTGSFEVRLNGVNICSDSNIDTQYSATNSYWNLLRLGYHYQNVGSCAFFFDDVYICGSNSTADSFLGDQRVDVIAPDGAGYSAQWTPDTGSNYARVNEVPSSDSSYVSSSTVDHVDSYTFAAVPTETPAISSIRGVQQNIVAKRTTSGVASTIIPLVRIGGINYEGSIITLADAYSNYTYIWETNPAEAPGTAWTTSAVNGAEFGYRVVSA